ncbi:MAG: hypothetical protein ACE3L7_10805 [Candidatus Pristimantibacillus sp.]
MPAEEAYVLSENDVRNIRLYVQHKYAAMPQDKKAEIVADAVNRIIHKQLPPFEDAVKRRVTAKLIQTVVLERQKPVRSDDIFEACLSLDTTQAVIQEPLHRWVEQQINGTIEKERFLQVMDKLSECCVDEEINREIQLESGSWERFRSILREENSLPQYSVIKESVLAEVIPLPTTPAKLPLLLPLPRLNKKAARPFIYGMLCLLLIGASLMYGWSLSHPSSSKEKNQAVVQPVQPVAEPPVDGLPAELRYTEVDKERLAAYLTSKSSQLASQPYMDAIIEAAKLFDIHPILLFAITGQEQAFVPTTNEESKQIANNPFNVFHSWKEYNTTIHDSAEIAARTIVNLSKGRPEGTDPITWINRKYAEDPNWSKGVRTIFATMKRQIETPSGK